MLASGFKHAERRSHNLGDVAQQARSIRHLRAAIPGVRVVAVAGSTNDRSVDPSLPLSHRVVKYLTARNRRNSFGRLLPRKLMMLGRAAWMLWNARRLVRNKAPIGLHKSGYRALRELAETHALLVSGAGVFNDRYATSVGAVWGLVMLCCRSLGKPIVLSGQQVGPLNRALSRTVTKWSLRAATYVGVRDPISLDVARSLGVTEDRLGLTGDDAWDLPSATDEQVNAVLDRNNSPRRFIAAQVRLDGATGFGRQDAEAVARLLNHAATLLKLPVLFVRMFYSERGDDRDSASLVLAQMRAPAYILEDELDAATTKGLLRRGVIAIGASYHFCVFAASAGTPTLGFYRSPYMFQKIRGLEKMWPRLVIGMALDDDNGSVSIEPSIRSLATRAHMLEPPAVEPGLNLTPASALERLVKLLRPSESNPL